MNLNKMDSFALAYVKNYTMKRLFTFILGIYSLTLFAQTDLNQIFLFENP